MANSVGGTRDFRYDVSNVEGGAASSFSAYCFQVSRTHIAMLKSNYNTIINVDFELTYFGSTIIFATHLIMHDRCGVI